MMKIRVGEHGVLELDQAYNVVCVRSPDGPDLCFCHRDGIIEVGIENRSARAPETGDPCKSFGWYYLTDRGLEAQLCRGKVPATETATCPPPESSP